MAGAVVYFTIAGYIIVHNGNTPAVIIYYNQVVGYTAMISFPLYGALSLWEARRIPSFWQSEIWLVRFIAAMFMLITVLMLVLVFNNHLPPASRFNIDQQLWGRIFTYISLLSICLAMAEHYFGGIGMANIGAFYKKLTDLVYTNQWSETIGGVPYTVSEPDNLQSAWLAGFEAGLAKRFTSLPGFWKGFGVDANYTYTNSQVKIPRFVNNQKIEDKSAIPKQAKHIFNVSLLYEYNKFMARIAGNYKGKYLDVIRQAAGPDHYRWYAENFTVDFSASYSITPKIRTFLELNNITNAPVRYYPGTFDRVEQAEWYSIRGQIGVSVKIF